ncbi:MAG: preprotein translocase subunit SecY [Bacilli bacterium]|nr:preprotein translocase subunit SecY [Bacilli bacterium]
MFKKIKQLFKPQNKDLRKRIYFTFLMLFVFKLGTSIIVPGINRDSLGDTSLGFFELINAMGGGALEQFSIFALGVIPYINASIVMQLLQMDIIPYFSELGKQGQTGRNKLNKITRYMGIVLAFIQGYVFSFAFVNNGSPLDYLTFALILTAGTSLLLWIGDRITEKGIGNGVSMIIMAGIIATLPNMFYVTYNSFVPDGGWLGILKFVGFVILYVAILLGVVFIETAERRIPIQYANKTTSIYGKQTSYIPFKLNSAGVMPVIFASIILTLPGIVAAVAKKTAVTTFVNKWLTMTTPTGFVIYIVCIFVFAYFYTFLQIKPDELSENLGQNGGFIPGVRPGEETTKYIKTILKRITAIGAVALSIVAAIPVLFSVFSKLPSSVSIGGTSLLIVVGVALEVYKQLESELVTRNYTRGRGKRK